ncbi:MAG: hypothetical protein BDTLLHRC_000431 [Candidatus Fervidibacter sp.]
MRHIADAIPEGAQSLARRWAINDLAPFAFALQALTALSDGEGRLLALDGTEFVTILAARNGAWDERAIGKTVALQEEPFAWRAVRKKRTVVAPFGLVRGTEPIAHCAAFLPAPVPLVLTLDLPLSEVRPVALWRFPHRLLAQIAQSAWGEKVPKGLLAWAVQGRTGVTIWDALGRRRWGEEVPADFQGLQEGLTVTADAVWLHTPAGTVARKRQPFSPLLRGYALLRSEVHHRVKNDLQSVISWLRWQARTTPVEAAKSVLMEAAERLKSFATVHDLLARERGEFVALRELIWQLAQTAIEQARQEGKQVRFTLISPEVRLSPKQASALAPALHEVLRNACEHAFTAGQGGTITVRVTEEGTGWCIEVSDDGQGFDPKALDGTTLGLTIARNLLEQDLGGTMEVHSAPRQGTTVRMRFRR